MPARTEFMQRVLDDVEKYEGIRRPLKASIWERTVVRKLDCDKMHPNPADEFSMENIGPNFQIIGNYVSVINEALKHNLPIFEEPVMVEKMAPEGYMLINGHHRWAAAVRRGVKKIHVQVVNVTNAEDIRRMMSETTNTKRLALDLDEVVFCIDEQVKAEKMSFIPSRLFAERMRLGVPTLISTMQSMGYDVWVYTATYHSYEYITKFFRLYGITVDGIINGVNDKRNKHSKQAEVITREMKEKYKVTATIDSQSVIWTNRNTAEVCEESIEALADGSDWSKKALKIIKQFDK